MFTLVLNHKTMVDDMHKRVLDTIWHFRQTFQKCTDSDSSQRQELIKPMMSLPLSICESRKAECTWLMKAEAAGLLNFPTMCGVNFYKAISQDGVRNMI
jgi:hypothetical protein